MNDFKNNISEHGFIATIWSYIELMLLFFARIILVEIRNLLRSDFKTSDLRLAVGGKSAYKYLFLVLSNLKGKNGNYIFNFEMLKSIKEKYLPIDNAKFIFCNLFYERGFYPEIGNTITFMFRINTRKISTEKFSAVKEHVVCNYSHRRLYTAFSMTFPDDIDDSKFLRIFPMLCNETTFSEEFCDRVMGLRSSNPIIGVNLFSDALLAENRLRSLSKKYSHIIKDIGIVIKDSSVNLSIDFFEHLSEVTNMVGYHQNNRLKSKLRDTSLQRELNIENVRKTLSRVEEEIFNHADIGLTMELNKDDSIIIKAYDTEISVLRTIEDAKNFFDSGYEAFKNLSKYDLFMIKFEGKKIITFPPKITKDGVMELVPISGSFHIISVSLVARKVFSHV